MARLGLKNPNLIPSAVFVCLLSSEAFAIETGGNGTSETRATSPINGKLILSYNKPSERLMPIFRIVSEGHVLAPFVAHANTILLLPKDVQVIFAECGLSTAFYKSATGSITICYEFLGHIAQSLLQLRKANAERGEEYDADTALMNATTFMFLHELGHALVDIYDIDVVGEEEAADGFATAILLDLNNGFIAAIYSAHAFLWMSKEDEKDIESLAFWDEHPFGRQRFYNIVCWVYGKMGSNEMKAALQRQGMQESRLSKCATEFRRTRRFWENPPKPWLKTNKMPR